MSRRLEMMPVSVNAHAGMAGGTALSFWTAVLHADLTETILLSVVGAMVSFVVSALLEYVVKKVRKRR